MKDRKKPRGTRARVQASKKKLAYTGTAITVAILIATITVSSFLVYSYLNPSQDRTINPDQTDKQPAQPEAAIVDHLSLSAPNQTFKETATNILKQAGYAVDYFPGEEVTVELFRNLPLSDYRIAVLRAHSAIPHHTSESPTRLAIFTSELYSTTKYVYEQLSGQLGRVIYHEESPEYFGIGPEFVKSSMYGTFNECTVIMMGCEGLTYTEMAEAFVDKGAKVYIGWNGPVQAKHTDQATIQLLKHLVSETQTMEQAVTETMKEMGPDPADNSILLYYPLEAGEQKLEDIITEN